MKWSKTTNTEEPKMPYGDLRIKSNKCTVWNLILLQRQFHWMLSLDYYVCTCNFTVMDSNDIVFYTVLKSLGHIKLC